MTTFRDAQHVRPLLSPEEAIVRDLISDRVVHHHRAQRQARRHIRTAVLLRRLAARLDPEPAAAERPTCPGPVAEAPRPWAAAKRPAAARH